MTRVKREMQIAVAISQHVTPMSESQLRLQAVKRVLQGWNLFGLFSKTTEYIYRKMSESRISDLSTSAIPCSYISRSPLKLLLYWGKRTGIMCGLTVGRRLGMAEVFLA